MLNDPAPNGEQPYAEYSAYPKYANIYAEYTSAYSPSVLSDNRDSKMSRFTRKFHRVN